jgi:hypothetical protein
MAKKPDYQLTRRYRHIDRGEDAFLPMSRMREIRWEEAVIRSVERRAGREVLAFRHVHFHCGTGCCLGTPIPQLGPRKIRGRAGHARSNSNRTGRAK